MEWSVELLSPRSQNRQMCHLRLPLTNAGHYFPPSTSSALFWTTGTPCASGQEILGREASSAMRAMFRCRRANLLRVRPCRSLPTVGLGMPSKSEFSVALWSARNNGGRHGTGEACRVRRIRLKSVRENKVRCWYAWFRRVRLWWTACNTFRRGAARL
jgi:hypothetical protein